MEEDKPKCCCNVFTVERGALIIGILLVVCDIFGLYTAFIQSDIFDLLFAVVDIFCVGAMFWALYSRSAKYFWPFIIYMCLLIAFASISLVVDLIYVAFEPTVIRKFLFWQADYSVDELRQLLEEEESDTPSTLEDLLAKFEKEDVRYLACTMAIIQALAIILGYWFVSVVRRAKKSVEHKELPYFKNPLSVTSDNL